MTSEIHMTLFDAIDREGALHQWFALLDGNIDDGYPLIASGELQERVSLYLNDKKQHKAFYEHHAKHVAYVVARLCLSSYKQEKSLRDLYTLLTRTPVFVYTLALVAQNKEPGVSAMLLSQLEYIAKNNPKYFMPNRTALTDIFADAYRLAWHQQGTDDIAKRVVILMENYATFTKVQQRHFDKRILSADDDLSRWYANAKNNAINLK